MSMKNSFELRLPFLDKELMNFSAKNACQMETAMGELKAGKKEVMAKAVQSIERKAEKI